MRAQTMTSTREPDQVAGRSAVEAIQDSVQGQFPPAMPLLVLAAYAVVFGFLAQRWLRWE